MTEEHFSNLANTVSLRIFAEMERCAIEECKAHADGSLDGDSTMAIMRGVMLGMARFVDASLVVQTNPTNINVQPPEIEMAQMFGDTFVAAYRELQTVKQSGLN